MIDSLTIQERKENCMPWMNQIDYFTRNPETVFKPGLNILFGGNGSGKSTVLQLLAQTLAATQGGTSVVTSSWMLDLFAFGSDELRLPCAVVHDGQPVMFFDARAKEGLIGGSFDDDFFSLGIANTMAKGSTGQLGLRRLDRLLRVLVNDIKGPQEAAAPVEKKPKPRGKKSDTAKQASTLQTGFPTEIQWRINRKPEKSANSTLKSRLAKVEEILAPKRELGPQTFIFDEPESGFSLPWQAGLWANIFSKVNLEKHQVIVATHSPFALGIPGAHYIEMSPGYLEESRIALSSLISRSSLS